MTFHQNYYCVALSDSTSTQRLDHGMNGASHPNAKPKSEHTGIFKQVKIRGDRDIVGNSNGLGGYFEDITVEGNDNTLGLHLPHVMMRSSAPHHQQAHWPNAPVQQGRGHPVYNNNAVTEWSSCHELHNNSQKRAAQQGRDTMVVDEHSAEGNDYDKMDLD